MIETFHLIYKVTSKITGLSYIGETTSTLEKRFNLHQSQSFRKQRQGKKLVKFQQAIVEHGNSLDNWELSVLEENIPTSMILEKERYYVKLYNTLHNGYNSNKGGGGPVTHSVATRIVMSVKRKGIPRPKHVVDALRKANENRVITEETRQKISLAGKGRVTSESTKEKLRISSAGRKLSDEAKKKISLAQIGRVKSESERNRQSAFMMGSEINALEWVITSPDGREIQIKNLTKYCKMNNLQAANMQKVSYGKRKSHKGFKCRKLIPDKTLDNSELNNKVDINLGVSANG